VFREVLRKCLIDDPCLSWDWSIECGIKDLKGKGMRESLCQLSLGAVVYHLWLQRNNLKKGNQPRTEEEIVKSITWEIRARMMAKCRFKRSIENMELCRSWNLPPEILGTAV
jgi:hypothetical protein